MIRIMYSLLKSAVRMRRTATMQLYHLHVRIHPHRRHLCLRHLPRYHLLRLRRRRRFRIRRPLNRRLSMQ